MLTHLNEDGIIQVYFDHSRPRVDPVVCVNVLTLFHENGRGSDLHKTLDYVYSVLQRRSYLDGTRYYAGAEAFLYFLSRLISRSRSVRQRFEPLFQQRIRERITKDGDSLALAMRVLACSTVGVVNEFDMWKLLTLQSNNGSWVDGWLYKYGSSGILIGNHGLTTAFAINAIEIMNSRWPKKQVESKPDWAAASLSGSDSDTGGPVAVLTSTMESPFP